MRLLFMGRKPSAAAALKWSVERGFTVVGVVTDAHLPTSATAVVARELGLPLLTLEEVYAAIVAGQLEPDVAVSYVYWRKIKRPLLDQPKYGIINFHPAPLPDYKGTAGYNLAILNSLDQWTITAHYADQTIDTGDIIDRFSFSIDSDEETALTLERKSQAFMLSLYKKTMKRVLQQGRLPAEPHTGGLHISRLEMEAMKQIQEDDDIDRKIRAFWFPPYTGAYVELGGVKYTLVNDQILWSLSEDGQTFQLPPTERKAKQT